MKKINLGQKEVIHFVGIGGIGMSGLAQIMKNMGFKIQGSDLSKNKNTINCTKAGTRKSSSSLWTLPIMTLISRSLRFSVSFCLNSIASFITRSYLGFPTTRNLGPGLLPKISHTFFISFSDIVYNEEKEE